MLSLGTSLPPQSFLGEHTRDLNQFSYLINRKSWSDFYRAATEQQPGTHRRLTKEFRHTDRSAPCKGEIALQGRSDLQILSQKAEEEGGSAAGKSPSAFKASRCRTLNCALQTRNTARYCQSSYETKKETDTTSPRMLLVHH